VQITWIDLTKPKGKAVIIDPATGTPFGKARKSRGSTGNAVIELAPISAPQQLVMGEGTETVLTVYRAMLEAGRDLTHTAFWAAIDLANLGGPALGQVQHPTNRLGNGHRQKVPGPEPDMGARGINVPGSVRDLLLLGDGDSDPFLTQCALARAAARYACGGRTVRAAWTPAGSDFNDSHRAERGSCMSAQAFRLRRRDWGVFIPIEEVSAHLACGWRVAEDVATSAPHELLMAPPPKMDEETAS
jgi:hypothetical protein